ncbi:MAG: CDP-diacylglycerol--serine O-phosphatidyltransferase [Phascolarctobacterium sp.]|uniref:CDP-diacylglycerol--serine O-phosphatidyltransferase n=1 Tax=Phascolarctobacterium sp. TaxID=2049039 RepID=UPI0026DB67C1|nr:CDP-diacylglycerol--serine O-phosphatidyltransferase [Phascolarctobacterium sp.]MDO4921067.1 CDP-diacylglycerol--serine O-phosphatidyltransferase [Phascolarctobacterium sp.]
MNYRRLIPNSISSASLIFGILSIFKTIQGDFFYAPIFIVIAVIFDSLDGRAARALGVGGGDFGKEMDSLCDMCSFGVAPAIMIYQFGLQELGVLGQVIAALFAVGGCLRLARFNCNTGVVHGYFQGMPIPAGACFLAAYVLSGYQFSAAVTAAMTLVIAVIMYSNVRFPDFKGKGNPMYKLPVIIALAIGAVMLFERPGAWPFVCMFTYTVAGIINHVYRAVTGKNK